MDPEVVRCFLEGANAGQDRLHCNCPPSCLDTNFKVQNLALVVSFYRVCHGFRWGTDKYAKTKLGLISETKTDK